MADKAPVRTDTGQFPKGVSGNPAGRPKGSKNYLTTLKQRLEIAVRENVKADRIEAIVERMVQMAEEGNVSAAKLILDKTISNVRGEDDDGERDGRIVVVVKNATFAVNTDSPPIDVIDAEVIE